MAEGGHAEEEPGAETVAASGAVDSEGVLRQEVTVGTDVGDNDLPPERERGVSGVRYRKRETLKGGKGFRAGNRGGGEWMDRW